MKKIFIGLFIVCCLFSSCLLLKEPPEEKVDIIIKNNCAWSINLDINYPNYNIVDTTIKVNKNPIKYDFYKGIPINIFLKGVYDIYPKYIYLEDGVDKTETWIFEWSSYENCYILKRDNEIIRLD